MAMTLGGTITDLQVSMSMNEVKTWLLYRKKYGPLNPPRMYDRPAALIASILSKVYGGTAEQKDFMPWGQEEREATLDDLVGMFKGAKIGERG